MDNDIDMIRLWAGRFWVAWFFLPDAQREQIMQAHPNVDWKAVWEEAGEICGRRNDEQ